MVNYHEGKIYKIVSESSGLQYIGSTCEPTLAKRMVGHMAHYRAYLNNKYHFVTVFKVLEYNDHKIYLIENFHCENKDQLRSREGYWIQKIECVNKNIAGRSYKEYQQIYKENNTEKLKTYRMNNKKYLATRNKIYYNVNRTNILEKTKAYQLKNKDMIRAKQNTEIICECGSRLTYANMARHKRSKKHIEFINK